MKAFLKIVLILSVLVFLIASAAITANASYAEYTVAKDGDEYVLTEYSGSEIKEAARSTEFSAVTAHLEARDGGSVLFQGVEICEDVKISSGVYDFSGSITFKKDKLLEVSGARISFNELYISFYGVGGIRLKSGELALISGKISSERESAVTLDYSAKAVFSMKGGTLSSENDSSAIDLKLGSAEIYGGNIISGGECGISNSTSLLICGSPVISAEKYDIITTKPITLSEEQNELRSDLTVKYLDAFSKGEMKCVFYSASAASISHIAFFDIYEAEYEITYFAERVGTSEKNFGAVYLPHCISFYEEGRLKHKCELLNGEELLPIEQGERLGFEGLGWSESENEDKIYDFKQYVNKSFDLYSVYKLSAPAFSISSRSFVYDGAEHEVTLDELSHPLLDVSIIAYKWYKNGEAVAENDGRLKLLNVSDSGEYSCLITLSYGTDSVSVKTPVVRLEITKAVVEIPKIPTVYYNGGLQRPQLFSTSVYTVNSAYYEQAGVYPMEIKLNDPENYEFSGSELDSLILDFEILKAENRWTEQPFVFDVYEGFSLRVGGAPRFGEVRFKYSSTENGEYREDIPVRPGSYYMIAEVAETDNYYSLISAPVSFSVIKEVPTALGVSIPADRLFYNSFDTFDPKGLYINITYNSQRTEQCGGDVFSYSYQSADSFRFGDTAVICTLGGVSTVIPVSVAKAEYDLSDFSFSDGETVYNGAEQSLSPSGVLPVGLDGLPLTCTVIGGGVNSGSYTVALSFYTESSNYVLPEAMTAMLVIRPVITEVVWQDTEFVYDTTLKSPRAYCTDIYGRKLVLSVFGARSLAGSYTAVASLSDGNYTLNNSVCTYTINKAELDFSGVAWIGGGFVYDGEEKCVLLSNLPNGVSVVGYSDNTGINAGEYTAGATLSYDEANYNPPPQMLYKWHIEKADYDLSNVKFSDNICVYDKNAHYPVFSGEMPMGADGIFLSYSFSEGAVNVCEGLKKTEIVFSTVSENYKIPAPMYAFVRITPRPIDVIWSGTEFVYDGCELLPSAYSEYAVINVFGKATEAGEYTASAVSLDENYTVRNAQVTFVIKKAQNHWVTEPSVEDIFEGRDPEPVGSAYVGDVVYKYYGDPDRSFEVSLPLGAGVYYAVAESAGDKSHEGITSSPMRFEVIRIIPVGLHIELNKKDLRAFDIIAPTDFYSKLENNDGSFTLVDPALVSVSYVSGGSLLAGAEEISFGYSGFEVKLHVSVKKADLDISNVRWSADEFIYDGSEKSIELLGLPAGLTVSEYIGAGVNAGVYRVEPVIVYDTENYNVPSLPDGIFVIKKQTVTPEPIPSAVYNGRLQSPELSPSKLYTAELRSGLGAGKYEIVLSINDEGNYCFENGLSVTPVFFEILPKKITIRVSDLNKYLFRSLGEPTWMITEGELVGADELSVDFLISDGRIHATSNSKNYDVEVIPGRIINTGRLAERDLFLAFFIFLLILLIVLALFLVYKRRALSRLAARIKCKFSSPVAISADGGAVLAESDSKMEEGRPELDAAESAAPENLMQTSLSVDVERADSLISDSLAKDLLHKEENSVYTEGNKKGIINVDTLSNNFKAGDRVDVNRLKEMSLVPYDTAYIKILARGMIDKPLNVYANDFSLSAVKMIALTGGSAVKVVTVSTKKDKNEKS